MKYLPTFEKFVNEKWSHKRHVSNDNIISGITDKLKDMWKSIKNFFSGEDGKVINLIKDSETKEEKEKILNDHIEKLAKKYINNVKKDDRGTGDELYSIDLISRIKRFLFLYEDISGKKHPRHNWQRGYFSFGFKWPELLKVDEKQLKDYFEKRKESINKNFKKELSRIEKEEEEFLKMLNDNKGNI